MLTHRSWLVMVGVLAGTGLSFGCHSGLLAGSGSPCGPEIPCQTFFSCVAGQCQASAPFDSAVGQDGDADDSPTDTGPAGDRMVDWAERDDGEASSAGDVGSDTNVTGTGGAGTGGREAGDPSIVATGTGGVGTVSGTGGMDIDGSDTDGGAGTSRDGSSGDATDVPIVDPCAQCPPDMACISGGTFAMGDVEVAAPIHQVTVSTFFMDRTEVTTADYSACVSSGACTPAPTAPDCNYGVAGRGNHPINCVSWLQASTYCEFARKRLPTEEEWEYAAFGREARPYPWSDATLSANRLNSCGDECTGQTTSWGRDGFLVTAPVGSFPAGDTPEGLHDMAGDLWEMTSSPYCAYPSSPCTNCPSNHACANPCGGCSDPFRVCRGGSWAEAANELNFRSRGTGAGTSYIGFRCVRE